MVERTADQRIRTTEWEDIQYKHGNCVGQYRTREMEIVAQRIADAHPNIQLKAYDPVEEKVRDKIARGGYDEDPDAEFLEPSGEDEGGGGEGEEGGAEKVGEGIDDEDDALAEFRRRRLAEIQKESVGAFGMLKKISGAEYVSEITNASANCWVVGLLAQQGHEGCDALSQIFSTLSAKYRTVKFVSVPVSEALPNFPKKQLPCVVLYHLGKMVNQLTTIEPWGGKRLDVSSAQRTLAEYGVVPVERDDDDDDETLSAASKYTRRF
jgi:hypothetical protein